MNKSQKSQAGSHLVILTVIITLAFVGALGFIYWQNFLQPKDKVNSSSSSAEVVDESVDSIALDKSITETVTGEDLTLNYPGTWVVSSNNALLNPDQETSNQKTILTSPDGNVKVTFWTGVDGIGGTCVIDEVGEINKVKTYSLPNYSGYKLYEVISGASSTGYAYSSLVLNASDQITPGSTVCNIGLGFFESKNSKTNQLNIKFSDSNAYTSSDEINTAMDTDSYKTAVEIVQSLHQK